MATTKKTYSFKSVGKTGLDVFQEPGRQPANEVPIGLKTPLQFNDETAGLFVMHKDPFRQVSDNLKNLILTNEGERVMQPQLGANILPLAWELTNSDVDAAIMARITEVVKRYMPFVNLVDFQPFNIKQDDPNVTAKLGFTLTFSVPSLSDDVKAIEIFLNAVG